MNSTKKLKQAARRIIGRLSVTKVVLVLIALMAFFSAVAMTVTSQTGFCNSCHIMNDYYASWETSTHSEVSCLSCHLQPGFGGYIKGKINGLAQAVDCMVGRVGTKAEA
ncbi:MAG: NapC/NirT family cytochrome c, partial [Planctomycetota bacterium]